MGLSYLPYFMMVDKAVSKIFTFASKLIWQVSQDFITFSHCESLKSDTVDIY
jgi:hypothetical protein